MPTFLSAPRIDFLFLIFLGKNNMTKLRNEKERIAMIRWNIFPSGSSDGDTIVENLEKENFSL